MDETSDRTSVDTLLGEVARALNDPLTTLARHPHRVEHRFTYNGTELVLITTSPRLLAAAVRKLRVGTTRRAADGTWVISARHPEQMPRRAVPVKASARRAR